MSKNQDESEIHTQSRAPLEMRAPRMSALATLPVFFKLQGKRAVLSGGSEAAAWKVELLSAAGAEVHVYAHAPSEAMLAVAASPPAGAVQIHRREWQANDLAGAAIAIGAVALDDVTGDEEAAAFAAAARSAGVPVNVVDKPAYCDFQFGAIVNRSPLVVSISTDGGAPVFAQTIRSEIESLLPQGFKAWAEVARIWRRAGERLGKTMAERRRFWELFSRRAFLDANRAPTDHDLEGLIRDASVVRAAEGSGFVSLVGAGPGDPELLTLKAVRALRAADVVLYDDLVTAPLLDYARRESRRILVGKKGYGPACKQTEINALMVSLAKEGQRVVRLKSGDPMIFGRAGEEMHELEMAGIAYEVIPGISAVQAAAAGLKVSLTHRDYAKRLQVVTGHSREGRLPENLDWQALADPQATTAVYMALRTFRELSDRLIAGGLPGTTPAVAVFDAARDTEGRIVATVAGLPEALERSALSGPCLVLIGQVFADVEPGETGRQGEPESVRDEV